MATQNPEDQAVLDQLVYRVSRAFYDPRSIVVMDVINKQRQVKDEELAATLKLTVREIHKVCGKLKEDRLIKDVTKQEARKPDQRPVPKTYYYVDYKSFVDVVKFKIHKMSKELDSHMSSKEVQHAGYRCPACHNMFTMVDVVGGFDNGRFLCPNDNCPLDEDKVDDGDQGQELKTKLRENTKPIVDLLKLTDNIVIEQRTGTMVSQEATLRTHDDDDLAFAADGGQQPGEIQVVFQDDNDKAAKKAREAEAQKKRQQNAVPSWHAWSTVSGEMTALGAEAAKRHEPLDDGKVEGEEVTENDLERGEYYKQYYENLALRQQEGGDEEVFETFDDGSQSSLPKRPFDAAGGGDDDSEIDLSQDSRKRSRPNNNDSDAFYDESGSHEALGSADHPAAATATAVDDAGVVDGEEEYDGELPEVSVAGVMVPLLEVTEEHQARMTPEEYLAYYNICQQLQ
ncbi:hypothetical protein DFQ27_001120 [Actinomortierella ambigua]|uniref:HTH TFE/IIEalpha-type domain-containing protein n=1 Tax=Actinomortierella ambigua TaxID=1343610 RepID=A0A9P6U967_9FUNG|nr:hypothetical protein DFQ27_001120 [Actinomortierella ambigua]